MRKKGIMQNDVNDCGIACLATICSYFNFRMPLIKFRELMRCDKDGISMYDICEAAEKVNLEAEPLFGTWEELCTEVFLTGRLPIIAHTLAMNNYNHYIVIKKYKHKKIHVFDPAEGEKVYSENEFRKIWTGNIIVFSRKKDFFEYYYKSQYKKFFSIIKENKRDIIKVLFLSLTIIFIEIIGVKAYQYVVDVYILKDVSSTLRYQLEVFIGNIHMLFFLILLLYLVSTCMSIVRGKILAEVSRKAYKTLLFQFSDKVINLPLIYYEERKNADILNRFSTIKEAANIFVSTLFEGILDAILICSSMLILASINIELFFVVLGLAAFYLFIVMYYRNPLKINSRSVAELENGLLTSLKESIEGIETIKAFSYEEECNKRFKQKIKNYLKQIFYGNKLFVSKNGVENYIEKVGKILIFWLGSIFVVKQIVSLGELVVFQTLITFFLDPIKRIAELQQEIQNGITYFRRLDDVYEATIEMKEKGEEKLSEGIRNIIYEHVCFSYISDQECLSNVNLQIKKGEKVAFIGESGSGKTTLLKLLSKMYETSSGTILINGIDIRDISTSTLRERIIFVSQNMMLFSDTLKNNLTLGNKNISDTEIHKVLEICDLQKVLLKHNMSLESSISGDGYTFSTGERQKIIIARVLLKKPDVIIFDEITSNLDDKTERKLWKKLFSYYEGTTFLIVSHKREIMNYTDRYYVIENGEIISETVNEKDKEENV